MPSLAITRRHSPLLAITRNQLPVPRYMMPMAQRQGRECADCLGNRRLERRLSLRRAEKHAFHGRGKLLLIGVMQEQKLQWGPLCPRQHCPTAWKNGVTVTRGRSLHSFTGLNGYMYNSTTQDTGSAYKRMRSHHLKLARTRNHPLALGIDSPFAPPRGVATG